MHNKYAIMLKVWIDKINLKIELPYRVYLQFVSLFFPI